MVSYRLPVGLCGDVRPPAAELHRGHRLTQEMRTAGAGDVFALHVGAFGTTTEHRALACFACFLGHKGCLYWCFCVLFFGAARKQRI